MPQRSFPFENRSVADARQYVGAELHGLPDSQRETAQLLVSELATNALLHSEQRFEVTVDVTSDGRARIAVTDAGDGDPHLASPGVMEEHGRGLRLVDAFADRWGVDHAPDGHGKTVWFEMYAALEVPSEN